MDLESENRLLREKVKTLTASLNAAQEMNRVASQSLSTGGQNIYRNLQEQLLHFLIQARVPLAVADGPLTEEQLRVVVDFSPALVAYVDRDQRYRFMNRLYQDWFELDAQETIGKSIVEVMGPGSYERTKIYVQRALDGNLVRSEDRVLTKNGVVKVLDLQFVPFREPSGETNGFVILGLDVTEQKKSDIV